MTEGTVRRGDFFHRKKKSKRRHLLPLVRLKREEQQSRKGREGGTETKKRVKEQADEKEYLRILQKLPDLARKKSGNRGREKGENQSYPDTGNLRGGGDSTFLKPVSFADEMQKTDAKAQLVEWRSGYPTKARPRKGRGTSTIRDVFKDRDRFGFSFQAQENDITWDKRKTACRHPVHT